MDIGQGFLSSNCRSVSSENFIHILPGVIAIYVFIFAKNVHGLNKHFKKIGRLKINPLTWVR